METYTFELTQPQIEMLSAMISNFNLKEYLNSRPEIEEEGSVSWYEDELTNLEEDILNTEGEIKLLNLN